MDGTLKTKISLKMEGDTPEAIKKTLNGQGDLLFTNGAIVGIDLAGMVRNIQASFTGAKVPTKKPKTDFSELHAPFTIRNGLVNTSNTTLQSPLIRLVASGSANLVSQALDMRVTPKFVATLKGQGDTTKHKGVMVPVLVKGTFDSPEYSPDLAGMLKQQLPSKETLEKTLQQQISPGNKKKPGLKKSLEGLLPKF
jgi:AsmA protein